MEGALLFWRYYDDVNPGVFEDITVILYLQQNGRLNSGKTAASSKRLDDDGALRRRDQ
jgi:hypothetical protein